MGETPCVGRKWEKSIYIYSGKDNMCYRLIYQQTEGVVINTNNCITMNSCFVWGHSQMSPSLQSEMRLGEFMNVPRHVLVALSQRLVGIHIETCEHLPVSPETRRNSLKL